MPQQDVDVTITRVKAETTMGGCVVPFLVGLLVLSLAVYGLFALRRRSAAVDERIRATWLVPWAEAVRRDDLAAVWARLTTDAYRQTHDLDAVRSTWRTVVKRRGPPTTVALFSANGVADVPSGRRYTRVVTTWAWARGQPFNITFELVEAPAGALRLDRVLLGGRPEYPLPPDLPDGPW